MNSSTESVRTAQGKSSSMDFVKPPVIETSLGFFFTKVPGWNVLHFGALWENFKSKYPFPEFPPPILCGGVEWSPSESMIPIRVLFTDADRRQLVQIQNDFFLHNWRKTDQIPNYEHYEQILPLFKEDWTTYLDFLKTHGLTRPTVLRCEMSYFNHIVRGHEWKNFEDLPKLFRGWRGFEKSEIFTHIELAAFTIRQSVGRGKVQIAVSPGVRTLDGKEILQMNVSASTVPTGSEDAGLFEALNECHQIALRSFDSFITDEILNRWGIKR